MMMRKEGSCRETRTSAQRHMSTPVRRMQMTVHPHQMMGEACKQKQDGGRFQIRINILIDRTFKANTIYTIYKVVNVILEDPSFRSVIGRILYNIYYNV